MVENGGKVSEYIKERMKQLEKPRIATADEVLQKFTEILRQEAKEEITELNPITGEFVTIQKSPSIQEVIRAGAELMKRYPTSKEVEKLNLDIELLKKELNPAPENEEMVKDIMNDLKKVFTSND